MRNRSNEINGRIFFLPALIITLIFYIYPLLKTVMYSFYFTGNSGELIEFAGLENFIELFSDIDFFFLKLESPKPTTLSGSVPHNRPPIDLCRLNEQTNG